MPLLLQYPANCNNYSRLLQFLPYSTISTHGVSVLKSTTHPAVSHFHLVLHCHFRLGKKRKKK